MKLSKLQIGDSVYNRIFRDIGVVKGMTIDSIEISYKLQADSNVLYGYGLGDHCHIKRYETAIEKLDGIL